MRNSLTFIAYYELSAAGETDSRRDVEGEEEGRRSGFGIQQLTNSSSVVHGTLSWKISCSVDWLYNMNLSGWKSLIFTVYSILNIHNLTDIVCGARFDASNTLRTEALQ